MKRMLMVVVVAVVVIAMGGFAVAATVAPAPTVSINAKVKATCANAVGTTIGSAGAEIIIDPTLGDQVFSPGTDATVQCSKNYSTVSIKAYGNNGAYTSGSPYACQGSGTYSAGGFVLTDGTNNITYNFACNAGVTGNGFNGVGIDRPLGVSIQVSAADAQTAVFTAGTYADTVTLLVEY